MKSSVSQSAEFMQANRESSLGAKMQVFQGRGGRVSVLQLEAHHRHPLCSELDSLLGRLGLEAVHHERSRRGERVIQRLYLTDASGQPLSAKRRLELQSALLPALAGAGRPESDAPWTRSSSA